MYIDTHICILMYKQVVFFRMSGVLEVCRSDLILCSGIAPSLISYIYCAVGA